MCRLGSGRQTKSHQSFVGCCHSAAVRGSTLLLPSLLMMMRACPTYSCLVLRWSSTTPQASPGAHCVSILHHRITFHHNGICIAYLGVCCDTSSSSRFSSYGLVLSDSRPDAMTALRCARTWYTYTREDCL